MSSKMIIIGNKRFGFKNDGDFYCALDTLQMVNTVYPQLTKFIKVVPSGDKEKREDIESAIFVIDGVSLKEFVNVLEEMEGE